ncbi:MAG: flagellin lysine-N-methylase [Clostridiales bacterium]|nr:flagellin lysine-N-methylase [Clostridiales bacterium]
MQYTIPHYYKKFSCTAGACPDTCCAGWQIQIDDAALKKYRKMKGPLGSRLLNEIDWNEKCFRRYNGRCAFLNEDNLCDLYLEGGESRAFCRTCRMYPRHVEEFEGLREISLSLSCPEAARIILNLEEPVRFLHGENPRRRETYRDFDYLLFTKLMDARAVIFHILQNRKQPLHLRMFLLLALSHDLQQRIDRGRLFETDALLEKYDSRRAWNWFSKKLLQLMNSRTEKESPHIRQRILSDIFAILESLEPLRDGWKPFLWDCKKLLLSEAAAREDGASAFRRHFTDEMTEQLMAYFLFTYFCGAVYSENADGKMRFSFVCTLLIRQLSLARYLENPGNFSRDTAVETAWRFAREIEHSDPNKYELERVLGDERRFPLEDLLCLLPVS